MDELEKFYKWLRYQEETVGGLENWKKLRKMFKDLQLFHHDVHYCRAALREKFKKDFSLKFVENLIKTEYNWSVTAND